MRKFIAPSLALLACSCLLVTAAAQKVRVVDIPVSVTVSDDDLDPYNPPYRIQSDGRGAYKHSSALQSIIQGIGDWELDMLNFTSSPQRTVLIDLSDPVLGSAPSGSTPTAPFSPQQLRARFIAKCSQYGGNMQTMAGGSTILCPLAVAFDAVTVEGGVQTKRRYRLNFNPENWASEVDAVHVTCAGVNASASKCNLWTVKPSTVHGSELKGRAKLIRVASSRKETDLDLGEYYLSFSVSMTNP